MTLKERRRVAMLTRVQAFGEKHASLFPAATFGGRMFTLVDDSIAQAMAAEVSLRSARQRRRGAAIARANARNALRAALQAVRDTARALAIDTPGIDRRFRLPRSRGDRALLEASHACIREARASVRAFVEHGLPTTFLRDLAADIERLQQTIRESDLAHDARVSPRAQVRQHLQAGLTAVRRLDAIVSNAARPNPAVMAGWRKARHIDRWPIRRGKRTRSRPPSQAA